MSGPIVRTGTTPEFWKNWDRVFAGKKGAKDAPAAEAKTPAKKTAKKAASAKPKAKAKKKA